MGLAAGKPQVHRWFHQYARGSGTHFVSDFPGYLIACNCAVRLQGCEQSCNGGVHNNFAWLDYVQSCNALGFWGFVEMGFVMKKKIVPVS